MLVNIKIETQSRKECQKLPPWSHAANMMKKKHTFSLLLPFFVHAQMLVNILLCN